MTLLTLFLLSMMVGVMVGGNIPGTPARARTVKKAAPKPEPGIKMVGVKAEITEDGNRIQQFNARVGRFNSDTQILLMDDLAIEFFDQNQPRGKATSPAGKVWLADDKKGPARRNDLVLAAAPGKPVVYNDPRQGILHSNKIEYFYDNRIMKTGPYQRWFQIGQTSYLGQGARLQVQLTTGSTQLKHYSETGRPATWVKIKKDSKP